MKRGRKLKRFCSGALAVTLMVAININPVATIAGAIADSGFVDKLHTLKDNLVYVSQYGDPAVAHAEESTPSISFECDASEAIDDLMGSGDVDLTTLRDYLGEQFVVIKGTMEEGDASIVSSVGDVNKTLQTISGQLSTINQTIENMQHQYRVAHLYSLNNEDGTALWRPYTSDVPYVEDFAKVAGPFASVYSGYWNASVSTITNPMGSNASRALYVLGYDAIVRYEGVVLQKTVAGSFSKAMSGQSITYGPLDGQPTSSAWTIASVEREYIDEDAVTWLDAVTLLYKALGQEQYTYQSFMSANYGITPETSPAFQGLSNIVPTIAADGSQHYEGFDYKMFISRSNTISGTGENATKVPVYWTKAVSDGFIPARADKNDHILASDFLKLAHKMMVAYGEPEMTMDETMALLQVYGTNFPISLGIDIADAWAYLKVRGCLSDDVIKHIGSNVSRDDLLDICMRIKDTDSRLDYKNIDVVLDIGELLRDDGYYPVYDLEFSVGDFSTIVEYDYTKMSSYGYLVLMTSDMEIGKTGKLTICSEKDLTKEISGAYDEDSNYEVEGRRSLLFTVPKDYTGNIFVAMQDLGSNTLVPGEVSWIEIPSKLLGGGFFYGSFTINNDTAIATEDSYHALDYLSGNKVLHKYADFERAGAERPTPTVAASNASTLEKLQFAWDKWTSPMVAYAAPSTQMSTLDGGGGNTLNVSGPSNAATSGATTGATPGTSGGSSNSSALSDVSLVGNFKAISDTSEFTPGTSWEPLKNGARLNVANDDRTILLDRLWLVSNYDKLMSAVGSGQVYLDEYGSTSSGYDDNITPEIGSDVIASVVSNGEIAHAINYLASGSLVEFDGQLESVAYLEQNLADTSTSNASILKWLLAAAPDNALSPDSDNPEWADKSMYSTLLTDDTIRQSIQSLAAQQASSTGYQEICKTISTLVNDARLKSGATYDPATNTFSFEFRDADGMTSLLSEAGRYDSNGSSASEFVNVSATVATSAVMSRQEEKLLSWEALVDAGVVERLSTGGMPTMNEDGSYHIMTKDGQVKVNPQRATIQIGTTIYDLMPEGEGKKPLLVYVDNDQKDAAGNGMLYFDVRCVMGIVAQDFVRNEEKTTQIRNALGSQGYVVYDIGAAGVKSALFDAYDINAYNYPSIPSTLEGLSGISFELNADGVAMGRMPVKLIGRTVYDDEYEIGGTGVKYWDSSSHGSDYRRLGLSSFFPTANWMTVIDDNGTDVEASLFVYYPIAPFKYGYVNDVGGSKSTIPDPGKDFSAGVAKTTSMPKLKAALDGVYPESIRDEWYIQMTYAAAADIYEMTGLWYLSGDFVIREFSITSNNYSFVEAWDEYSGVSETKTNGAISVTSYNDAGNATGAVYWLDGIGFVYNMPTVSEFSLEKYFSGEYPLPVAVSTNSATRASGIGIINYNMNYWGVWVDKTNANREEVPYGYTLSSAGYVHYKDTQCSSPFIKYDKNNGELPTRDTKSGDFYTLPFRTPDSSLQAEQMFTLAPSGVYFYFGGNTKENAPPSTVTETLTNVNQFYYGSNRVTLDNIGTDGLTPFNIVSTRYNPIMLDDGQSFYRVYRRNGSDVLINNGIVNAGAASAINEVIIDDYVVDYIENPLDKLGATNLLNAIDEGASFAIIFAFQVLPMIGIILMTILVGLSFLSDNRTVQLLCEKIIDPVRVLTFGNRDITHWSYKTVLVPCILLYVTFALFLNGNIIRIVVWLGKSYAIVSRYAKNIL